MITRYRYHSILFLLALILGVFVSIKLLIHTHSEYYELHNRFLDHRDIEGSFMLRDQGRSQTDALEKYSSNAIQFTTNFTFPTPQERLKYYMGDWYNKSILPLDISCNDIDAVNKVASDQPVLWNVHRMVNAIVRNSTKEWIIRAYMKDAFEVICSKNTQSSAGRLEYLNQSFILFFGDSHSHSTSLPVIAKTRFSRFAIEKRTGKQFFDTIIWPLEMQRHYPPVNQYMKIYREGKVCAWEDKKSTLIWRGGVTGLESDKNLSLSYPPGGPRLKVVSTYYDKNISLVDVAFQQGSKTVRSVPHKFRNVKNFCRRTDTSMVDQLKYKYMLMLEGNDVATGLKWQLASNSVVFMARPTTVSFLMEDLLVPFVHYVPLKDDYSDLIQMVHWARENDAKCKWISEQATLFMNRIWISQKAKRDNIAINRGLSEIYQRQFGEAVKSCAT